MPSFRRFAPAFLLLSLRRPVEKTMRRARHVLTLAIATLTVALIALIIIAIAALLWITAFIQGGAIR